MKTIITDTQYKQLPERLQKLFTKLYNPSSEEVRGCFPDSKSPIKRQTNSWYPTGEANGVDGEAEGYGDSGNASRFFKSIIYQSKPSKSERNNGLPEGEKNIHPTLKPVKLMEYLIKMVTKEGGTVLDPFTGSGTTLVAAKKNGYKYIGFELDEGYRNIANKRIQDRLSEK